MGSAMGGAILAVAAWFLLKSDCATSFGPIQGTVECVQVGDTRLTWEWFNVYVPILATVAGFLIHFVRQS